MAVRRVKKKTKRRQSLGTSNLKLQGRRRAVAEFNALLGQLGADALSLGREVVPARPLVLGFRRIRLGSLREAYQRFG